MTQEINPKNGIKKSFYQDGALRYEARYRRGVPHGVAYGYYPEGNLKTQDSYKRGLRNGMAVGYYHNGTTKSETLYKNGKKHGVHKEYDEDGNLIYEAHYKKDILQMRKIVEQNGNEQYLCTDEDFDGEYVKGDDANTIKERRYYLNGALWMETTLRADSVDDAPVMHGIRCYYRPDGTLISEMPYCDDALEGVWKRYDEEGKLVEEIPYQGGKKNGLRKWRGVYGEYFANYKDDVRHGEAYTREDGDCFYKEGKLHGKCLSDCEIKSFKNGVLHGLYRRCLVGVSHPYLVIPYKNGRIEGVAKHYIRYSGFRSNPSIDESLEYLNGGRDMVYRSFRDGEVEEIEIFKDFRPVAKQYYRYENGVMESEELYKNGLLEAYREYYDTGVLFEERQYCLGELSVERRYYPSGKIFSETPYEEGEQAGETKYYDEEGNLSDNARCVAKFYNDGQSLCIEQIFFSDGRFLYAEYHKGIVMNEHCRDGEYEIGRWYHDNGLLEEEWRKRNGLEDGVQRSYYADGTLASQKTYRYVREEYDGVVVEDSYPVGEHQEFYEDGRLKSYTRYEDGNPIGVSKTYHPDGTLESKKTHRRKPPKKLIPLKNGKPHGIAIKNGHSQYDKKTYHYKNGRLIKSREGSKVIHYEEGKPSLIVWYGYEKIDKKRFYKKGVLSKQEFFRKEGVERIHYDDGGYGVRRLHYANGQVSREVLYKDGVEDSTICEYREDGSLLYENYYDGERQTWVRKVYERDGEVKLEYFQKSSRHWRPYRGGTIRDGGLISLEHYANGNVRYEKFEAHQIREERYYYEDGGLQSELGGDGLWRYYHRNGSLCYEGDDSGIKRQDSRRAFESNTLWDFTKKYYYYDGGVESEIPYKDSLPHGVERRYYRDGGLKCEISHYKGKKEGEVRCYGKDGKLEATALYQDDRLIDGEDGASKPLSSKAIREVLKHYGVLVPKMQSHQSQQLENPKSSQI